LPRVEVVLVRPETPANVGATARVLANTGLDALCLVDPGDYRTVECWRTAWGGHDILERARVVPDLAEALSASQYAVGLSGKTLADYPAVDVREMAAEVRSLGREERASLVFGPETSGLTFEELAVCGRTARIPCHPDQPSLNLSHAVMVVAYEVFRARPGATRGEGPRATHEEKARLLDLLTKGLRAIHALGERSSGRYLREWEAIIHRTDLSQRELRLVEHAARKMMRAGRDR
jgi:TrmH family RNA methyltransferase